jgi:hypothetical protein
MIRLLVEHLDWLFDELRSILNEFMVLKLVMEI